MPNPRCLVLTANKQLWDISRPWERGGDSQAGWVVAHSSSYVTWAHEPRALHCAGNFLGAAQSFPRVLDPGSWMALSHNQWQTWAWLSASWSWRGSTMEGEGCASSPELDTPWLSWMTKIRSSPGILLTTLRKIPRGRFQLTLVQPAHHKCKPSCEQLEMCAEHWALLAPLFLPRCLFQIALSSYTDLVPHVKVNIKVLNKSPMQLWELHWPQWQLGWAAEGGDFTGNYSRRRKLAWKKEVYFWILPSFEYSEIPRTLNPC